MGLTRKQKHVPCWCLSKTAVFPQKVQISSCNTFWWDTFTVSRQKSKTFWRAYGACVSLHFSSHRFSLVLKMTNSWAGEVAGKKWPIQWWPWCEGGQYQPRCSYQQVQQLVSLKVIQTLASAASMGNLHNCPALRDTLILSRDAS